MLPPIIGFLAVTALHPTYLEPIHVDHVASTHIEVISTPTVLSTSTIKKMVEEEFYNAPIMVEVAWCESQYRQTDETGTPLRGIVNPDDVGIFQINEFYHLLPALRLGINIYSAEGNIQYARILYDKKGTRDWSASEPCWKGY